MAVGVNQQRKYRVGIIGCGEAARLHLAAYMQMPDVEIVAGCDTVGGRASELFAELGIRGARTDYATHKRMLDDETLALDMVSVCTDVAHHAVPAIYALSRGVHVLLERPMAATFEEAIELSKAQKDSGKLLHVAFHYRHGLRPDADCDLWKIGEKIASGKMGKIESIKMRGGALMSGGGDLLDAAMLAVGYPKPRIVRANATSATVRLEGNVMVEARFAESTAERAFRKIMFVGGKGYDHTTVPFGETVWVEDTVKAFVDAVRTGSESPVPVLHAVYNQAILSAIEESRRTGCDVDLLIPEI